MSETNSVKPAVKLETQEPKETRTLQEVPDMEVKALIYDNLISIERCQKNVQSLNKELQDRQQNGRVRP